MHTVIIRILQCALVIWFIDITGGIAAIPRTAEVLGAIALCVGALVAGCYVVQEGGNALVYSVTGHKNPAPKARE